MGNAHIWQRMLWKEFRENWAVLFVGVALPLGLLCLPKGSELLYPGIGLTSILLTLWAAERAHSRGIGHKGSRIQLPVTAALRWTFTYLIPALVPVAVGAAVGYLIGNSGQTNVPTAVVVPAVVLYMLANFTLSTVVTAALSVIPAIMLGVALLFGAFDMAQIRSSMPLFLGVIAGALLASLVWELSARKQRYLLGRIGAVLALAGFTAGALAMNGMFRPSKPTHFEWQGAYSQNLQSPDRTLMVEAETIRDVNTPAWGQQKYAGSMIFCDIRSGRTKTQEFPAAAQPIGFINLKSSKAVLLLQQKPGDARVHLLRWGDSVSEVTQFLVGREALKTRYTFAEVSPDGRYALVAFNSKLGVGYDLWLLDLPGQSAALITANTGAAWEYTGLAHVSWCGDHAILSNVGTALNVDLHTKRAALLHIATDGRTAR